MNRSEFAGWLGGGPQGGAGPDGGVIEDRDPARWRRAFATAAAGRGPVFLANPDWGSREKSEFEVLVKQSAADWDPERGWLMIPTGGSSGRIKLARHDQSTLLSSVRGYQEFFAELELSAVGMLPLHHVGGLMAWIRAAVSRGAYIDGDWPSIRGGGATLPDAEGKTISLVPTQLGRLLESEGGAEWLRGFTRVLIGGAALDPALAQRALEKEVAVVRCYGSTETAALIAAESSADRIAEGLSVLPHASITVNDAGEIEVRGGSVAGGYWPDALVDDRVWKSGDLGRRSGQRGLIIEGRADDLIISGGEKVNPREVETVLRELVADDRVAVVGAPDAKWGQRVVAVHAPALELDLNSLKPAATARLAAFKWPKQAIVCDPWPINAVGKLDRAKLRAAAQ